MNDLDFPFWLRANHFINLFCIFLLMRSGIQILADHPKLYWNDDTSPPFSAFPIIHLLSIHHEAVEPSDRAIPHRPHGVKSRDE